MSAMDWVRTAVMLAPVVLLTGCGHGYGCIVHGDWTLEFNKVPYRGGACETCDVEGPPVPVGPPLARSCGACRGGVPTLATAPHSASRLPIPRFHPVPTRPVFEPAPGVYADGPAMIAPASAPAPLLELPAEELAPPRPPANSRPRALPPTDDGAAVRFAPIEPARWTARSVR